MICNYDKCLIKFRQLPLQVDTGTWLNKFIRRLAETQKRSEPELDGKDSIRCVRAPAAGPALILQQTPAGIVRSENLYVRQLRTWKEEKALVGCRTFGFIIRIIITTRSADGFLCLKSKKYKYVHLFKNVGNTGIISDFQRLQGIKSGNKCYHCYQSRHHYKPIPLKNSQPP